MSSNTKEDILKNVGNQTWWTPLTSVLFFFFLWKSMGFINCHSY